MADGTFYRLAYLARILIYCGSTSYLMTPSAAQELPNRNEENFQFQASHAELFYDTKTIPDGSEVSAFVTKDVSSRYFFLVEENISPLTIVVSPCSSAITTYIRYQSWKDDYDFEAKPESKDEFLSNIRQRTDKNNNKRRLLVSHTGSDAVNYHNESGIPGLYSIEIIPLERDSSVRLYASTSPYSDRMYPELPTDAKVKVRMTSTRHILAAWKPSPSDVNHLVAIEYCVSINKKQHFRIGCAAQAYFFGDLPPPLPPNAGFGFNWEKKLKKIRNRNQKSADHRARGNGVYECVGNATNFTYSEVESGATYYVDVFAVNRITNSSTGYFGARITTTSTKSGSLNRPQAQQQREKVVRIEENKVYRATLKRSSTTRHFQYRLRHPVGNLTIVVQSCSSIHDPPSIVVEKDRILLNQTVTVQAHHVTYMSIPEARPGLYKITIFESADAFLSPSDAATLKIAVSTTEAANPFPSLPVDTQIKPVLNVDSDPTNSDCGPITLLWHLPKTGPQQPQQQYCLYRRKLQHSSKVYRLNVEGCSEMKHRKKSERIACKSVPDRVSSTGSGMTGGNIESTATTTTTTTSGVTTTMAQVMSDMESDTQYVFDVYATKKNGESLSYKTLKLRTGIC